MPTRFYFSSTVVAPISPAFAGGWDGTAEGVYRMMHPYKDGSALTEFAVFAGNNHAAGVQRVAASYVSPPLAAGSTFSTSHTLKMTIKCRESALNDNINRMPVVLKVWDSTGSTALANLKALGAYGASTTEWPISNPEDRQPLDGDTLDAGYTTTGGERLVLEVGGQVSGSGGTSVQGYILFGSPSSADLPEAEGSIISGCPWFEISTNLTFQTSQPCHRRRPRFFKQKG